MRRAGRRDGHLGRLRRHRAQETEMVRHDGAAARDLAGDARHRRHIFGGERHADRPRELDAVELAQEVEMPEVAAVFAVGHGLEADLLLFCDRAADACVLHGAQACRVERSLPMALARLAQVRGTKEAADLVGVEGRSHEPYCAVIPAVRITFSQRWRSSRRNVATSPGVMAAGWSPASTRRFCTSGIFRISTIAPRSVSTTGAGVLGGAKSPVQDAAL